MRKDNVLYLGNYLDEQIVKERGLPTNNIAGTNRMQRLTEALNFKYNTLIVSPGVSLRIKKNTENTFLKTKNHAVDAVHIKYAKTLAIPFIGLLFSFFSYPSLVFSLIRKQKPKIVVVYNFDPLLVFITSVIKLFFRNVKIVNNIEDVSIPKIKDFSKKSEDRGLQQYIFYFCMKIIAKLSHAYIIPTKKFIPFLPEKENILVITGCITIPPKNISDTTKKLQVLFSGKIAFEHGIDVFIDALKLVDNQLLTHHCEVNITGGGNKVEWLKTSLKNLDLPVKFHGFVSNSFYNDLLQNSDVCIALQKDTGRHSNFKTPSKVYEYLGNSKLVVATDVGDLSELGVEIIKICKPLSASSLSNLITNVIQEREHISLKKEVVYNFVKEKFDTQKVGERLFMFLNN